MPIYEFKCACGCEFEYICKDVPKFETCPKCGGPAALKVSRSAFHLKGTGWYQTDYTKNQEGI